MVVAKVLVARVRAKGVACMLTSGHKLDHGDGSRDRGAKGGGEGGGEGSGEGGGREGGKGEEVGGPGQRARVVGEGDG